jgi:maleamate amidohydrolase
MPQSVQFPRESFLVDLISLFERVPLMSDEAESTVLEKLEAAMQEVDAYYQQRGIFQGRFGFGKKPAIVVVDFANGWTDEAYAAGTRRLDGPVESTAKLLVTGREKRIPVFYTTSPIRPHGLNPALKTAADSSPDFRKWDVNACEIDSRVLPAPEDIVIEKENASAFFGTSLASYLVECGVDTVLITGCSTSACIRATATDAKAYRFKPVIVRECVGDRAPAAHLFTLFDIQARFADIVSLDEALDYLSGL